MELNKISLIYYYEINVYKYSITIYISKLLAWLLFWEYIIQKVFNFQKNSDSLRLKLNKRSFMDYYRNIYYNNSFAIYG